MFLTVSPMIVAAAFWSHAADTTRIQDSIKRLGNRSFQEREAAMRWLLERPQAADFVKEALQSQDAEVAKRAAILLEHYDRKPVRDLLTAAKTGRFQQFAHRAGSWKNQKYDDEVLAAARMVGEKLVALSKENGGPNIEPWCLSLKDAPTLVAGNRLTEIVKARKSWLFYRGKDVDLPPVDGPGGLDGSLIVSSGPVRVRSFSFLRGVILAAGPVHLVGANESIIVSSGDIRIDFMLFKCLVIANGKVICNEPIHDSLIISATSVVCKKANIVNSKIIENEPNPLGFVRFSTAAEKDTSSKARAVSAKD